MVGCLDTVAGVWLVVLEEGWEGGDVDEGVFGGGFVGFGGLGEIKGETGGGF